MAGTWEALEAAAAGLEAGLCEAAQQAGIAVQTRRVDTMFTLFFSQTPPRDWATGKVTDTQGYACFLSAMLENGVYLPPLTIRGGFCLYRPQPNC